MSALVKTIKSRLTDDTIYPVTKADAVYLNDNITTVEDALENKISNTGGIVTGNLRVNTDGTNAYAFVNNVPLTRGEAPSSSTSKGGFIIGDQNGVGIGRIDAYFWQNGYEGVRVGTARDVGGTATGNYVHLGIDNSGNKSVIVSDITSWCKALEIGEETHAQLSASTETLSIASGTATAVMNMPLSAGTYIITGTVGYQSKSDTTYRKVALGSSSTGSQYTQTQYAAPSSGNCYPVAVALVKLTANSTVYLSTTHGASGSATVNKNACWMRAVKVGKNS